MVKFIGIDDQDKSELLVSYAIIIRVVFMDNYKYLKNILYHIIDDMNNSCSLFCENPDTDFIRSCKLDFKTTSILCMETSSLKDKFYQLFDYSSTTPASSTFV